MAKTVVMPQMGYDMDAGTLLRWLKQEGDAVERGEAIAEIETDKVNIEIEAFEGGVLRKTLITEGQTVPVGDPIAIIGTADEPIDDAGAAEAPQQESEAATESPVQAAQQSATAPAAATNGAAEPVQQEQTVAAQASQTAQPQAAAAPSAQPTAPAEGERVRASPLVRRIAAEHEIDLTQVTGTGPHGRIVKRDIEDFMTGAKPKPQARPAAAAPAAVEEEQAPEAEPAREAAAPSVGARPPVAGELVDLPRIRQTIGKRMSQSFQQAPHFYVTMSIDMGKAMEMREQINAEVDEASQVSVNDIIVKASAIALRDFPVLNSAWADGKMQTHGSIDVGIAIAIEGGLISPFIPEADSRSLGSIARMTKDLAARARNGQLKPEEYQGGTFTTSNLGMFGVDEFIAIINPPQASILAIGSVKRAPVWDEEAGEFQPRQMMKVTMSADHRLTDGAEVARFLQRLKQVLESPLTMLVG